jgi:predicted double-glycine peptidase
MMVKPEERATIKQKGFSLLNIAELSSELGYKTVSYNLDSLGELRELNFPSIVRVILNDISHFVVVKQITHNRVLLADPAWGNRSMTHYQFSKVWQRNFAFFVLPKNKTLGDKSLTNALTTTLPIAENRMDIEQMSPNVWLQQDFDKFTVNTTPMVLSK